MLIIDITINRIKLVSSIGATRIHPDEVDENTICTYSVGRVFDGRIFREMAKVKHRYGDGAEELARKMLNVATEDSIDHHTDEAAYILSKMAY